MNKNYKNKDKLKELIDAGLSCKDISKYFNVSYSTIKKYTNMYDLKFKNRYLSDEVKKSIIQDAENGVLYKDICKKYPISSTYISEFLAKNGVKKRTARKEKYKNVNFDYFETIDTEHKAYWLGFIMADGCISKTSKSNKKPNRLQINISNKDINLLKQFCNDINMDTKNIKVYTPKGTYSTNKMCKIYINSQKLCSDLSKYGIIQNKTGKEQIPDISDDMIPHFIRGFFDGDGCTLMDNKTNKIHGIEFCSNQCFLETLQNIFIKNNILKEEHKKKITKEKRNNQNLHYLTYVRKYIVNNIFNYMYKNSTIYLKRKYENFDKK